MLDRRSPSLLAARVSVLKRVSMGARCGSFVLPLPPPSGHGLIHSTLGRGRRITSATEGLIVMIWHIMASDDGDEDADGDGGRP